MCFFEETERYKKLLLASIMAPEVAATLVGTAAKLLPATFIAA
ncbi:Putative uncharacterized protein [Lactobacillus delbrueckii subsp. lactis]|nr:Putative uncharacterized protein [Lactobacillus delbrueckii subsp. lactis]